MCIRDRIESCLNRGNCGLEASDVGDMVKHIGVGDLFLIAGQSNAVGYGRDYIPVSYTHLDVYKRQILSAV